MDFSFEHVEGPPIIVDTQQIATPVLFLYARFLSIQELYSCKWYLEENVLQNLSDYQQITTNETFTVEIYGVPVLIQGYSTILTFHGDMRKDTTYSVVLFNEYGNSSYSFRLLDNTGNVETVTKLIVIK